MQLGEIAKELSQIELKPTLEMVLLFLIFPILLKLIEYALQIGFKKYVRRTSRELWSNELLVMSENIKKAILTFREFESFESRVNFLFLYTPIIIYSAITGYTGIVSMITVAILNIPPIIFLIHRYSGKIKRFCQNSEDIDDLVRNLRRIRNHSFYLRYFTYGLLLFNSTVIVALLSYLNEKNDFDIIRTNWMFSNLTITLALMFLLLVSLISDSRKLQRDLVNCIRDRVNENYVKKAEVTVFTNLKPEGISGRLIDIFDENVIKLEDEKGEKFLIPWDSVGFLAIKPDTLKAPKTDNDC